MLEGGPQAVQADEDVVGTSRVRELERRVRELERLLGRKTTQVEILKEARAVKISELAAAVMERSKGRFAMKAVADTLAVASSKLIERVSGAAKSSPAGPTARPGTSPCGRRAAGWWTSVRPPGTGALERLVNRRQKAEGKFNMDASGCRGSCRPTN